MKLGRHRRKRIPTLTGADARHRTAPPQSPAHFPETAGSGAAHRLPDPGRRRTVGSFRGRCRWAAARLRTATGVTGFHLEGGRRSDQRPPWLGLLLWALACAGLFVSLLMQTNQMAREPRLAAREASTARGPTGAFSLPAPVDEPHLWRQNVRRRADQST